MYKKSTICIENIKIIRHYFVKRKKVRQIGSLYASMLLGIILGIGTSVINTRLLGPQKYGDLKFLQTLFTFFVTFLTFGFFVSGSRLVALKKYEEIKKELIGNLLILSACISIIMIISLVIFSFYEEKLFNNNLGRTIRIFSPLLFVFPFKLCLENIMQGDNRIYELSVFQCLPQIIYILAAMLLNYFIPLSLFSALLIQLVTWLE
jgi:O-antigen/teichoic acid export membrane protein